MCVCVYYNYPSCVSVAKYRLWFGGGMLPGVLSVAKGCGQLELI